MSLRCDPGRSSPGFLPWSVKEASRPTRSLLDDHMTPFIIMIPLMVLAIAIATIPVLYLSVREHNLLHFGTSKRPSPARPVYAVRRAVVGRSEVDA